MCLLPFDRRISFFSEIDPITKRPHVSAAYLSSIYQGSKTGWSNVCEFCQLSFPSKVQFQQHMSQDHREYLPFACEICQRGFFTNGGLQLHMKDHEGRQFSCSVCDQRFKRKYHLKGHIRKVHKLWPCTNCWKTFNSEAEFSSHISQCG